MPGGKSHSVPSSPTGVNPASRSSKAGSYSPRRPHASLAPGPLPTPSSPIQRTSALFAPPGTISVTLPFASLLTPPSSGASTPITPAALIFPAPPSTPAGAPACASPGVPGRDRWRPLRPMLWIAVVVLFNWLGHEHPVLWSAEERAHLAQTWQYGLSGIATSARPSPASLAADFIPNAAQVTVLDPSLELDPSPASPTSRRRRLVQTSEQQSAVLAASNSSTVGSGTGRPQETGIIMRSPYTTPWSIHVAAHKSCRKMYPLSLVKRSQPQGPISYVGDLLRKRQRILLSVPRHGLGNSLRGFVSSFVYAALSGRRLVRFHGAEHAKVWDTLCHSFQCGMEGIAGDEAPGGSMGLTKQLDLLNPVDMNSRFRTSAQVLSSLRSTAGLFLSRQPHFFDGFWNNFPHVQQCVFDSFGCSSLWCVHSRAIWALVGPPTGLLEDVISRVLMRHTAEEGRPDVPALRGGSDMFDVALHLRTRPAAIESKNPGAEDSARALMKIGCGLQESGDATQYLKGCLWNCLGGIISKLEAERKRKDRPLQILLATDNEQLRPAFVEKLAQFGEVFYSSGRIVHSSKSASDEADRLPTMAEFHLMSRSHTILEAGSYISTFAYFSGLLGNGTLAGINWQKNGGCGLRVVHRGELVAPLTRR